MADALHSAQPGLQSCLTCVTPPGGGGGSIKACKYSRGEGGGGEASKANLHALSTKQDFVCAQEKHTTGIDIESVDEASRRLTLFGLLESVHWEAHK